MNFRDIVENDGMKHDTKKFTVPSAPVQFDGDMQVKL